MQQDAGGAADQLASVASLQLLLESTTDFAIVALDPEGKVVSWNAGAEHLLGWSAREMIGRSADITFTAEDRAAGEPEAERRKARAEGRAEDERWHQRKDGSRFWGSGLAMALPQGRGFAKLFRDRTAQRCAEEQLRESESRFRALATHIPQLVFQSRATGHRTWGSPQWVNFTGLSDSASRAFGWLDAIHPEDVEATRAAWREAQETGAFYVEHRVRRTSDGQYRWHQTRATPLPGADDPLTAEWVGTSADIHELRAMQERQQLLLAELQHRTRNLLAVVQALAQQTLGSSSSLEEFAGRYEHRLGALSRVQALLCESSDKVRLGDIILGELQAHGDGAGDRVSVSGAAIDLPAGAVQTLTLAVHELATNAVKYGALGPVGGRLTVSWDLEEGGGASACRALIRWRESGVAMPAGERRRGYGTELITRALPYQLGAETSLAFRDDGVECVIALPLESA